MLIKGQKVEQKIKKMTLMSIMRLKKLNLIDKVKFNQKS